MVGRNLGDRGAGRPLKLHESLPLDEKCTHGKLDNGMAYYVQSNKMPEERAELRLVVKIGSVYEAENECGLAHMVEHLAFRGTAMYDTFEVVRFLEAIGARFGPCQNAYTSFDETVYFLKVPIDKGGLLEQALTVLREWAFHVRCSDEDIEAERGIVMEEWRQGRTAGGRTDEDYFTTLMQGSEYSKRLPIGKVDVIKNCSPETVRGFYKRWYHPKRMAIVAVGDFDSLPGGSGGVVDLIKELFEVAPQNEWVETPELSLSVHEEPMLSCFSDSEATNASVVVDCKRARQPVETEGDYRRTILEHLFHEALSSRFYKVAVSPAAPFFNASTSISFPTSNTETAALSISVGLGGELKALERAMLEIERVSLHGITEAELKIAKANLLSDLEADHIEKEQLESEGFCNQFVEHFVRREPAMGVGYEVELCTSILPTISVHDVAQVVKDFAWDRNCVIKVTRPRPSISTRILGRLGLTSGGGVRSIRDGDIKSVMDGVEASKHCLDRWEHAGVASLDEVIPLASPPGSVVSRVDYGGGVSELKLSNGMTVCLKPTRFLDDEVQFKAFALGGLSELQGSDDLISARLSASIAGEIGAFGAPNDELVDMTAGMRASVSTDIKTYSRVFTGECSPSDLWAALRMVNLLFRAPLAPTDERLEVLMRMMKEQTENQFRSPQVVFAQRCLSINTSDSPFWRPILPGHLSKVSPDFACSYFKHCFNDPSEFTLVMCGNFEVESVVDLINVHISNIPRPPPGISPSSQLQRNRHELPPLPSERDALSPVEGSFPPKSISEDVRMSMVDPLCCTKVTIPVVVPSGKGELEESILLSHAMQVLESRLVERMRFELGAIYNVSASVDFSSSSPSTRFPLSGTAGISFTCDPKDIKLLVSKVFVELRLLAEEGPSERDVSTRVEICRREHETSIKYNSWWVDTLVSSYSNRRHDDDEGSTVQASLDKSEQARLKILRDLSPALLREVFARHFSDDDDGPKRFTVVSLRPTLYTRMTSFLSEIGDNSGGGSVAAAALIAAVGLAGAGMAALALRTYLLRRK